MPPPIPTGTDYSADVSDVEPIGQLLTRLRLARRLSQLQLASRLCDASGRPTVTRHEVARWERHQRVPGIFWLRWLAVVLDVPLEVLERAAASVRPRNSSAEQPPVGPIRLWERPAAAELQAILDHARVGGLAALAHLWLAGPDPDGHRLDLADAEPALGEATDSEMVTTMEGSLSVLRRLDDVIGGLDLSDHVDQQLRTVLQRVRGLNRAMYHPALPVVAGFAQLAGWVHSDAGEALASRRAYRVALRAAAAGGDRQLAIHVLGSLAHERLRAGSVADALALARAATTAARTAGSPGLRALVLHRLAMAAAGAGARREAVRALAAAERAADRIRPGSEPKWLYWLDGAELNAMTGRCLVALGRPLRAVRMLAAPRPDLGVRTSTLDAITLARCYVDVGEVEEACRVASRALLGVASVGSARAARAMRILRPLLQRHRDVEEAQRYEQLATRILDPPICTSLTYGDKPRNH